MHNIPKGTIFENKFEILEVLGSGGVGTVYKAVQCDVQRLVALKVLHAYVSLDEEYQARLTREAKALRTLEHSNIVTVYSLALTVNGALYMVMEYLQGKSLRQVLSAEKRLPVLRALRIIKDTARALAYVHKNNIVHRDLKPENIFLSPLPEPDTVKLLDFGLARLTDLNGQKLTCTGLLVGTPAYMSPEQCEGKPADCRSDVYSLTICLYELITGARPFAADTPIGILYKHKNEPMPAIKPGQVDLFHPKLNELISRGTSKSPEERYKDMNELADDIDTLASLISASGKRVYSHLISANAIRITGISLSLILISLAVTALIKQHFEHPQSNSHPALQSLLSSRQHLYRDAVMTMKEMTELASAGRRSEAISVARLWLEKYSRSTDPESVSYLLCDLSGLEEAETQYKNAYDHLQDSLEVLTYDKASGSQRLKARAAAFNYLGVFMDKLHQRKKELKRTLKEKPEVGAKNQALSAELERIDSIPDQNGNAVYQQELEFLSTLPAEEGWVMTYRANAIGNMGINEYNSNHYNSAKNYLEQAVAIYTQSDPRLYKDFVGNAVSCHTTLARLTGYKEARSHFDAALAIITMLQDKEDISANPHVSDNKVLGVLIRRIPTSWLQNRRLAVLRDRILLDAEKHEFDFSLDDVKQALNYMHEIESSGEVALDSKWNVNRKAMFKQIYYLALRQSKSIGGSDGAGKLASLILAPENNKYLTNDEWARWKSFLPEPNRRSNEENNQ